MTIRVERGRPTDEELAALLAVLHVVLRRRARATVHARPRHDWRRPRLVLHGPAVARHVAAR